MCGKLPENVPHVLAGCGTLPQTKYLERHNAALKIPNPNPSYENGSARALWDVPVYADSIEVRTRRIDARIVDEEQVGLPQSGRD